MGAPHGWEQILFYLVVALPLFPIGGYFVGLWAWKSGERKYAAAETARYRDTPEEFDEPDA
ncbi:MAG: hypothetical protein AAF907_04815 [Planctomycetota bacterium]